MRCSLLATATAALLAIAASLPATHAFNPILAVADIAAIGAAIGVGVHAHRLHKHRDGLEAQVLQMEDRIATIEQACHALDSCPVIPPILARRQLGLLGGGIGAIVGGVKIHHRHDEIRALQHRKRVAEHKLFFLEHWAADLRRGMSPNQVAAVAAGVNPFAPGPDAA